MIRLLKHLALGLLALILLALLGAFIAKPVMANRKFKHPMR